MGIGTMSRGEKAIIYVSSLHLTQSPFMPEAEGYEEVQFEVELVHFIQVCLAYVINGFAFLTVLLGSYLFLLVVITVL